MNLLVISSAVFFPEEADVINRLFGAGMTCFHLRKPEASKEDLAKLLTAIAPDFMDRIAIHQHHELAQKFGIKRLHFTETTRLRMGNNLPENLTSGQYIPSTSVHEPSTINSLSPHFSYTFLSPVFDSISKPGYKSAFNDDFRLPENAGKMPVIALGGINAHNIGTIKKMKFAGAAIMGALWTNPAKAVEIFSEINDLSTQ